MSTFKIKTPSVYDKKIISKISNDAYKIVFLEISVKNNQKKSEIKIIVDIGHFIKVEAETVESAGICNFGNTPYKFKKVIKKYELIIPLCILGLINALGGIEEKVKLVFGNKINIRPILDFMSDRLSEIKKDSILCIESLTKN